MNLRNIANGQTRAINPNLIVQLYSYLDYTVGYAGKPAASYAPPVAVTAQVQALNVKEIEHLDSMNIAGCERAAYVNQQVFAVDRATQRGGDVLVFEDGPWQVTAILEGWTTAGWCKAALTKQMPVSGQFGAP